MKTKLILGVVLSVFLALPAFADKKDNECFRWVKSNLKKSHQFKYLIPDAWKASLRVTVKCTDSGISINQRGSNLAEGQRVEWGTVRAAIVLKVQPLNGVGGTEEKISVNGTYGNRYKRQNSGFFDVASLSYNKKNLR